MNDGDAPEVMSGADLYRLLVMAQTGLDRPAGARQLNEEVLNRVRDKIALIGLRGDDLIVAVR